MTTLTLPTASRPHRRPGEGPSQCERGRGPAATRLIGYTAILILALLMQTSPRAVLAMIPGGPDQPDLGFGLGQRA